MQVQVRTGNYKWLTLRKAHYISRVRSSLATRGRQMDNRGNARANTCKKRRLAVSAVGRRAFISVLRRSRESVPTSADSG